MRERLLMCIISIIGIRIFEYEGNRDALTEIHSHKVLSILGASVEFRFYEKHQLDVTVRGNVVTKSMNFYYVIEALFSDEFMNTHKKFNNKKYYLDFKYNWLYPKNILLPVLLDRFVSYLNYEMEDPH